MDNSLNWKRMMFKGHKVYLCVDEQGEPVVRDDKVLIKYQINHDYEYYVSPEAVQPIDPNQLKKKKGKTASKKARVSSPPASPEPARHLPEAKPMADGRERWRAGETVSPIPEDGVITIYTDGASSGNPGPSGIGIYFRYGDKEKEISEYIGNATNNIAELTAIKVALKSLKKTDIPVRLYTDSKYCYGLLMLGWKAKMNSNLVNKVRLLMKRFKNLKIIKVEGHAGVPENERADQLARAAVENKRDY
ncbi:MAG: ribonuclease H [Pseudomonadota bacterium]